MVDRVLADRRQHLHGALRGNGRARVRARAGDRLLRMDGGDHLVIVAFFFLPRFLRAGIYTIPEYLEYRYMPQKADIVLTSSPGARMWGEAWQSAPPSCSMSFSGRSRQEVLEPTARSLCRSCRSPCSDAASRVALAVSQAPPGIIKTLDKISSCCDPLLERSARQPRIHEAAA
jgi:hypothetical protein